MCELCNKILELYNDKINQGTIFVLVFHRILDFKYGVGFLSGPLFYFSASNNYDGDNQWRVAV